MTPQFLASILATDHPLFAKTIADLEAASGGSGVDVRLIADIRQSAHDVMREIGVDPADTSSEELYHALNTVVQSGRLTLLANTQYVLLPFDDGPVSFNLIDVIENTHHAVPYAERSVDHAHRHLRREIIRRYAEHDRTSDELVHNLAELAGLKPSLDSEHAVADAALGEIAPDNGEARQEILMIGDIFTDAFITLGDETAKIIKEGDAEWLAVPFGRKPPYEKVDIVKSVGPSPNVAVSIARLGYDAALMAWVGGDATGVEAIEHLQKERVSTESMVTEQDKATSYWYVLCYGADRTMLVKSEKYTYEWHDPATKPAWIYLAYIGEDSWPLHEGLLDYLERNPDIKFALQPGTFQFKWGPEKLKGLYGRSHVVLMNREEAMDVTGLPYDSIKNLADGLHELGPEIVVITDGPNGSYVSAEGKLLTIPNYPDPSPPVERTGAGDAFSSTFIAAIAAGESVETALLWAPVNSASVVQHVGAQKGLLTKAELEEWLSRAPAEYKVSEFSD